MSRNCYFPRNVKEESVRMCDSDMIETKPKVINATMDSCWELAGSRQHGDATISKMFNQHEVSYQLNALGNDSGWAQTQMFANFIARDYEQWTKNLTFYAAVAISSVRIEKTILQRILGHNHVKYIQHTWSAKVPYAVYEWKDKNVNIFLI